MTSICSSNNNNSYQHFQLSSGNILLQQHQQQQQLLLQQQQHQQLQLIAPKLPLGNSQLQNMQHTVGHAATKKKYATSYATLPYGGGCGNVGGDQLPSVARRNARERNRVKQVNNGFVNLRQHLPQSVINTLSNGGRGASKKLSKVDTLRIAVEYIRGLQDMLDDGSESSTTLRMPHYSHSGDESSNDGSYSSTSSLDSPTATSTQHPSSSMFGGNNCYTSYHSGSGSGSASASPTPSYSDAASDLSASYVKQEIISQPEEPQFKFESFDSFSDEQPDDEELLDYISSWQEQ